MIKVLKYGGTSVATVDKIKNIAADIVKRASNQEKLVVVVSAMGKTTNQLLDLMAGISAKPSKREMDMLLATGEQTTIALLSTAIKELGYNAISLTGAQAGILTNDSHSKARIESISTNVINRHLEDNTIVVVAGFQGISATGDITTLGRGGSDTTAVALAAALKGSCEIYTDVEGIFTVDPRYHPKAKKLKNISYDEMLEMANLGANVLEPRAVEMAYKYNIPLYVGLSNSTIPGTHISERNLEMESTAITGLSIDKNCIMASVKNLIFNQNNIAELFGHLARRNLNIDMISIPASYHEHVTVSFTAVKDDYDEICQVIKDMQANHKEVEINANTDVVKLSVVGIGMISHSGVAANIFRIFAENNVHFYQVTTSEISISYTIASEDIERAIQVLTKEYQL